MDIKQKKQEKEQDFKAICDKEEFMIKGLKELNEEKLKIMGEYRLLEELSKEEPKVEAPVEEVKEEK